MKPALPLLLVVCLSGSCCVGRAEAPAGAAAGREPTHRIFPDQALQTIWGLGFEIQSDSIGSGNQGLPEEPIAVPHDLSPAERERLAREMLKGFRYCRLAGGLYWRGLDPDGKYLRPRWPEQLEELRQMLDVAGVEGVSLEYWSPAPFWKANNSYVSKGDERRNVLRCFGPDFAQDPVYQGDADRFLSDFGGAVVTDIRTLNAAGIRVSLWGLQNEPFAGGGGYSKCVYRSSDQYVRAYRAVAAAIRRHDTNILLFADTESNFPDKIAPGMKDPEVAALVDAYVVHTVGAPSEHVRPVHERIRRELPFRPWFQNEYEYLTGGATRERCLNTVQHIMNSFQLAGNPTWFWIHALKPYKNAEASGYSLGFWKSLQEPAQSEAVDKFLRWRDGPEITALPDSFRKMEMVLPARGDARKPGAGYYFTVNQPATLFLLVDNHGESAPAGWEKTDIVTRWKDQTDLVFKKRVEAGKVQIPGHTGKIDDLFGAPHVVFIEPSTPATFQAAIGMNVPIVIRSEYLAMERAAAKMAPGSWIYNPYNWNAVGSFAKRMPWDSVALKVDESGYNKDARIFAFRKPDGKRTLVVSNRTGAEHRFEIETGLPGATWRGYRYTPDEAGPGTRGVSAGTQEGARLTPSLPHLTWEFWEEQ